MKFRPVVVALQRLPPLLLLQMVDAGVHRSVLACSAARHPADGLPAAHQSAACMVSHSWLHRSAREVGNSWNEPRLPMVELAT